MEGITFHPKIYSKDQSYLDIDDGVQDKDGNNQINTVFKRKKS